MWAFALPMELGPNKDRKKFLTRVGLRAPGMSSELRRKQTYLIGMIGLTGGFSLAISGTSRTLVRVVSPPRLQKVSWSAVTCKTGQSSYLRQKTLTNLYAFPGATLESTDFTNLGFQYPAQLPQGPLERCHNIRHPWTRALWLKLTIQVFCNFLKPSNYGKRRETNSLSINCPERIDISIGYLSNTCTEWYLQEWFKELWICLYRIDRPT